MTAKFSITCKPFRAVFAELCGLPAKQCPDDHIDAVPLSGFPHALQYQLCLLCDIFFHKLLLTIGTISTIGCLGFPKIA